MNHLLNNVGAICHHEMCGSCEIYKFLIDLLFILQFEDLSIRRKKKEITKIFKKIKETDYNLGARHFLQRFDSIFMKKKKYFVKNYDNCFFLKFPSNLNGV